MERKYIIEWYPTREGEKASRRTRISLSKPVGDTSVDAKNALNIFTNSFGSLKKNTISYIKEFDEKGQIGKDIVPAEGSSIVPIAR